MMDNLPALSELDIHDRIDDRSSALGFSYFRSGAVSGAQRDDGTISGRVQGSRSTPYRVWVRLGPAGIEAAECSCPVGDGGYCKHVAALLFNWLESPEAFRSVATLDQRLAARGKDELIALIKQMLRRDPDLEDLLDVPLPASGRALDEGGRQALQRQAEAAFALADRSYEWGIEGAVAGRLQEVVEIGDGFQRQGDLHSAADSYMAVLDAFRGRSTWLEDEAGDMMSVEQDCIERLGELLANLAPEAASDLRREILETLFAALTADIQEGGRGTGDPVPDIVVERTTPGERAMVATWVRDAMAQQPQEDREWTDALWGELLIDLELDKLDDEAYLRIAQETGQTQRFVGRLLELGRVPEAIEAVRQADRYELLELADLLVEGGQAQAAEMVVTERLDGAESYAKLQLLDWLLGAAQGDPQRALGLARQRFDIEPSFAVYRQLRELGRETATWPSLRPELLNRVKATNQSGLLLAIHLDEGEIDDALRIAASAPLFGTASGGDGSPRAVAEAAEATRPEAALQIYAAYVDAYIEQRNRSSYQQAVRVLGHMRDLYTRLGQSREWAVYLAHLREHNTRLRALKEELELAHL